MTETKLFFGFNNSEGTARVVTDAAWEAFLANQVTPLFSGFTVFETVGYWNGKREMSRTVSFLHDASAQSNLGLNAIRQAYCETFAQTSVLRIDSVVDASF